MTAKPGFVTLLVTFLLAACQVSPGPGSADQADATTEPTVANPLPTATALSPTSQATSTIAPRVETQAGESGNAAQSLPNADVLFVEARQNQDGAWTFAVTVGHEDTGWEDYADGWNVVLPDGTVVKPDPDSAFTRLLLHPHVDEQPFTRSQSGIEIPTAIDEVTVRAHDLVDGFGGKEITIDLSADEGPGFVVSR